MPRCYGYAEALVQQLYNVPVDEAEIVSTCDVGRFGKL